MEKKEIPVTGPEEEKKEQQHVENDPVIEEMELLHDEDFAEEATEITEETEMNKSKAGSSTEELNKLTTDLGEMKDKYLRLYAEFDNYRKRTLREREDLIKTAAQDTLKSILPTLDDFERAIKAAKTAGDESIIEGIVLISEKLLRTLEQQGLKAMESDGQTFDPDLHEALTKVPVPSIDMKGKVIETIEKGYYLKDKIIRYAKVVIGQ
jgi:molecular chaperone GrpE